MQRLYCLMIPPLLLGIFEHSLLEYSHPEVGKTDPKLGRPGVVQTDSGSGDAGPGGGGLRVRLHLQLLQQPVCSQGVCAAMRMALHPLPGQTPC